MKLEGRRESTNVVDRRGKGSAVGTVGGLGIGGLIIVGLLTWLLGGDPGSVLQEAGTVLGSGQMADGYTPTAEEEELAKFSKQILAGTEDVWTAIFKANGLTYEPPQLVLFSGAVQSGCGGATSQSGPFYCSADRCVYLDLSFFTSMKKQIGADGDFAYAYVIAHEVGHHVQNLLGTLGQAHQQMSRYKANSKEYNQISVRLELQADFYAGVWAHHDNKMFGSLEPGDIDEGLAVAAKIGDDYLQKQAYGYTVPDSFNHGTSAQRSKWLKKGIATGDPSQGNTFDIAYNSL
jgi:hypothetical protein